MKCELLQLVAAVVGVNSCSNIKVDTLEFMGTSSSIYFYLKTASTVLINLVTTKTSKLNRSRKYLKQVRYHLFIINRTILQNTEMSALRCLQTFCANKIIFFKNFCFMKTDEKRKTGPQHLMFWGEKVIQIVL